MTEFLFWYLFDKIFDDMFFFKKFCEKYNWLLKNSDYCLGVCINDDGSFQL